MIRQFRATGEPPPARLPVIRRPPPLPPPTWKQLVAAITEIDRGLRQALAKD